MAAVDRAAAADAPLSARFACLAHAAAATGGSDVAAAQADGVITQLCTRWRVPNDCRELALLLRREQAALRHAAALDAQALVALIERCDALRRGDRFDALVLACACIAGDGAAADVQAWPPAVRLRQALAAARGVDTAAVATQAAAAGQRGPAVGAAITAARVMAVAAAAADRPVG